jgi:hypothetical protein
VGLWVGGAVVAIVVLALGAFFLLGTTADSAPSEDDWAAFTDPATGLTVDLPGDPETESDSIPVPDGQVDVYLHIVETRDAAWSFGVYDLTDDAFDLDLALEGGIQGMAGTLVSSRPVTFAGFPGIDAEATFREGGTDGVSFMRLLRIEGQQAAVLFQSVGKASERDMLEETFERLAGSFVP